MHNVTETLLHYFSIFFPLWNANYFTRLIVKIFVRWIGNEKILLIAATLFWRLRSWKHLITTNLIHTWYLSYHKNGAQINFNHKSQTISIFKHIWVFVRLFQDLHAAWTTWILPDSENWSTCDYLNNFQSYQLYSQHNAEVQEGQKHWIWWRRAPHTQSVRNRHQRMLEFCLINDLLLINFL